MSSFLYHICRFHKSNGCQFLENRSTSYNDDTKKVVLIKLYLRYVFSKICRENIVADFKHLPYKTPPKQQHLVIGLVAVHWKKITRNYHKIVLFNR